jgi:hypothetical protein
MRDAFPLVFAGLVLLAPAVAGAQTYKCIDAAGKVTYTGTRCSDLGLKDAGEVRNKINISPAQKVARPAPAPAPASAPAAAKAPAAAAAKAPAVPADLPPDTIVDEGRTDGKRCFTVKTAKGVATRCNDKPE